MAEGTPGHGPQKTAAWRRRVDLSTWLATPWTLGLGRCVPGHVGPVEEGRTPAILPLDGHASRWNFPALCRAARPKGRAGVGSEVGSVEPLPSSSTFEQVVCCVGLRRDTHKASGRPPNPPPSPYGPWGVWSAPARVPPPSPRRRCWPRRAPSLGRPRLSPPCSKVCRQGQFAPH